MLMLRKKTVSTTVLIVIRAITKTTWKWYKKNLKKRIAIIVNKLSVSRTKKKLFVKRESVIKLNSNNRKKKLKNPVIYHNKKKTISNKNVAYKT